MQLPHFLDTSHPTQLLSCRYQGSKHPLLMPPCIPRTSSQGFGRPRCRCIGPANHPVPSCSFMTHRVYFLVRGRRPVVQARPARRAADLSGVAEKRGKNSSFTTPPYPIKTGGCRRVFAPTSQRTRRTPPSVRSVRIRAERFSSIQICWPRRRSGFLQG